MKNTKKWIVLYVFMFICLISTAVYAALKIEVKVNMSAIEFKPGEQLVITLSTNSVTGTEKGIFAVDGYVKYDSNVFEALTKEDFSVKGDIAFNPTTNKFAIDLSDEILNQDQLFVVTLTVKEDATPGNYEEAVSLEDIEMFTMDQGSCMVGTKLGIEVLSTNLNNNENKVENNTVNNNAVENNTVGNNTVENNTVENNTVENNTIENNTVENNTVGNNTVENNTVENNIVENNTVENNTVDNTNTNVNTGSDNTNVGSTNNEDNTTSDKILPATGKGKILISTLIILVITSYIWYAKYMRLRGIED